MTYQDDLALAAEELMRQEPRWAAVAYAHLAAFRASKDETEPLVDVVLQVDVRNEIGHIEGLFYAAVRYLLIIGAAQLIRVPLGVSPKADVRREENVRLLSKHLPASLTAQVAPGSHRRGGGDDGAISWETPVRVGGVTLPASVLPLEIGSTEAATTFRHLLADGGVARWPYGAKDLWLLVAVSAATH